MNCCFFWEFLKGMETTWVEISFSVFQVNLIVRFFSIFRAFSKFNFKKIPARNIFRQNEFKTYFKFNCGIEI